MNETVRPQSNSDVVLANLFFLAVLFPFVSPVPVEADTQPVATLIAVIILIVGLWRRRVKMSQLLFLIPGVLSLLYLSPAGSSLLPAQWGKYVSLLAGSLVFVVASENYDRFRPSVFYASVAVYFVWTVLMMVSPEFFIGIQSMIVRGVNQQGEINPFAYRGTPTFATEAGLFGGLVIFFLVLNRFFYLSGKITKRRYALAVVVLVFLALASKSGTGYVYLMIYAALVLTRTARGVLVAGSIFLGVAIVVSLGSPFVATSDFGRGAQIAFSLFDAQALAADTSTVGRLTDFLVGFISLLNFPFGAGANSIDDTTALLAGRYAFLTRYYGYTSIGLVSGLAWWLVAYGLFGLLFVIYVYVGKSKAPFVNKAISLLYLSFSYSPALPATWVLIAQPSLRRSVRSPLGKQVFRENHAAARADP